MQMSQTNDQLLQNRNRSVARSLYRHLRAEGFNHEQIITLSATLLDLVTEDLQCNAGEENQAQSK